MSNSGPGPTRRALSPRLAAEGRRRGPFGEWLARGSVRGGHAVKPGLPGLFFSFLKQETKLLCVHPLNPNFLLTERFGHAPTPRLNPPGCSGFPLSSPLPQLLRAVPRILFLRFISFYSGYEGGRRRLRWGPRGRLDPYKPGTDTPSRSQEGERTRLPTTRSIRNPRAAFLGPGAAQQEATARLFCTLGAQWRARRRGRGPWQHRYVTTGPSELKTHVSPYLPSRL